MSDILTTPFGTVVASFQGDALRQLRFADADTPATPRPSEAARDLQRQLDAYFAGTRQHFDLPLALTGSDFSRRVWAALRDIPYGHTASYGDIAARIGQPGASRAVGRANGANPVWLIVPCHRVIRSGGDIGGYGGGVWRKRALLELEARALMNAASAASASTTAAAA